MLLTIPPFVVKKLIVLIINSLENEHNSYADVESCKSQNSPNELLIGRNKDRRRAHISYCDIVSSFEHVNLNDSGKKYGYAEVKSSKSEDVMSDCDPKESGVNNMLGQITNVVFMFYYISWEDCLLWEPNFSILVVSSFQAFIGEFKPT